MASPSHSTVVNYDEAKQIKSKSSKCMFWFQSLILRTPLDNDDNPQNYTHTGDGTQEKPYVVDYRVRDRHDAMGFTTGRKWAIAMIQALSFFAVTFGSSVYTSGIRQVMNQFHVSNEVATLGLALYVLGFAIGPILWAPMSEVYGRRFTFVISYTVYIAFTVAASFAPNITGLLLLRFLASAFGSSAQVNPGVMIADMFIKEERGPVMGCFASMPFAGPALGPIVGGFIAETVGWRYLLGINAIVSGVVWIAAMFITVETYAPVILRTRAKTLSRLTGHFYVSRLDVGKPSTTFSRELSISLVRPWIFLVREPIVLITTLYVSIIYAILYMFFSAIPIVFEVTRGWSQGIGGLPFLGVLIGIFPALIATGVDSKIYKRQSIAAAAAGRTVEPEAKLRNAMLGSFILPLGLMLFAWTTYPTIPWIGAVIGITISSCGLVMVFISLISYLVDTYAIYASSALAANTIIRSFLATAFPLFTTQMYSSLGNQWASSLVAFLTIACVPFPFLFCKYGARIRAKCKYAAEAAKITEIMERRQGAIPGNEQDGTDKMTERHAITV